MKTIGLIGGMSWESTVPYYQAINTQVRETLGGLHSAKIILWSVDFEEVAALQRAGQWDLAAQMLADAAKKLELAGAESIVICTNTMHKIAPQVQAQIQIPLLHIADATGVALTKAGIRKVGLMGTRFTMEDGFYTKHLEDKYGLTVITPEKNARQLIHDVIFNELCIGIEKESSRAQYREIMTSLVSQGAEAIILGCTEIGLLVDASDAAVPLFDTTYLHAAYAAQWSLTADK